MFHSIKELTKTLLNMEKDKLPEFAELGRRAWLEKVGYGVAGAAGASVLSSCGNGLVNAAASCTINNSSDAAILNSALQIEQEAIAVYTAAAGLGIWGGGTGAALLAVAVSFRDQHSQHASDLTAAIVARGGTPAVALTATQYFAANGIPDASVLTLNQVLKFAEGKEKAAALAYSSLSGTFTDISQAKFFAQLAAAEGAHYSVYRAASAFVIGGGIGDGVTSSTVVSGAYPALW